MLKIDLINFLLGLAADEPSGRRFELLENRLCGCAVFADALKIKQG